LVLHHNPELGAAVGSFGGFFVSVFGCGENDIATGIQV
jgi:hypothetical protein